MLLSANVDAEMAFFDVTAVTRGDVFSYQICFLVREAFAGPWSQVMDALQKRRANLQQELVLFLFFQPGNAWVAI